MELQQHSTGSLDPRLADDDDDRKAVFDSLLRPHDSYDEHGVYWADMGLFQRVAFVSKIDRQEAAREWGMVSRMFKRNPLSPVVLGRDGLVGSNNVLAGFEEASVIDVETNDASYVLFSIGNLKPLFQKTWPACWKGMKVCNPTWLAAIEYLEICGIIVGQIFVGVIGDWVGRRWGLIQDAVIMFLGLLMLTASWGVTLNGWVICYAWSLFVYGVGVGGEYPMTATSVLENAKGFGQVSSKEDRLHRGRNVTSAFLMQGWGQLLNQALLIILLLIFHHGNGDPPYSTGSAQWTFRISFAIPAVGTLWLVYYRAYKMRAAGSQLSAAKRKASVTGYDLQSLKLTCTYYGPRLFATAGTWFANDFFFYGNRLFQEEFIRVISPGNQSVMEGWLYNLINVGVSLVGYYLASLLIDHKLYGRRWMQIVGFLCDFILFVIPAFHFHYYRQRSHVASFQAMYFLSSFFNQFGPNTVTFLVAAEVFPTPIRATAHGVSAAVGKLGALAAAVLYNYISTPTKFLVEQERRWCFIRRGRPRDYHGVAVHPKHLSVWERFRGQAVSYDPDLDYRQRIDEMRGRWLASTASLRNQPPQEQPQEKRSDAAEKASDGDGKANDDAGVGSPDLDWPAEVSSYFERTTRPSVDPRLS
ncbi:MAG: hypothetical protein M1826_003802 [Phylliscum demangeonii]|nr:MAG: hypothetical protein M1826_003802 [Phylliscum demangeonii]